ncbi:MAG: cobalamin-dependent protein [Candidatus Omnitrophota bacterium]
MRKVLIITIAIILAMPPNHSPEVSGSGSGQASQASALRPMALEITKEKLRPEFTFYTREKDGTLLEEPCGFPGDWTVEVRIPKEEDTTAAVERVVKSFALTTVKANREDIKRAKFTVINGTLPKEENILAKIEDFFCITSSEEFGLEIIVNKPFLYKNISEQRKRFLSAIEKLPRITAKTGLEISDTSQVNLSNMKALIFNDPFKIDAKRGNSSLLAASFHLAGLLKQEKMGVKISNFVFKPEKMANSMPGKLLKILTSSRFKKQRDAQINELKEILQDIDMVCVSVYEGHIAFMKEFFSVIRKAKPGIIIAVGGPSPTITPEHIAAHLNEANIVYRGDAEAGFIPVLKGIKELKANDKINPVKIAKGLQKAHGTMVNLGGIYHFSDFIAVNRMTEKQLNERLFDFSLLNENNVDGAFPLMTSLGCPHKCSFCIAAGGSKVRLMSPKQVIKALKAYEDTLCHMRAFNIYVPPEAWCITIGDDDFIRGEKKAERALKIFEMWKQENLEVKLVFFGTTLNSLLKTENGKKVVNSDLLKKIDSFKDIFLNKKPRMFIGTEAFFDNELEKLNKNIYTEKHIEDVIKGCEFYNINNDHGVIYTNEESSLSDLIKTILKVTIYRVRYSNVSFNFDNLAIIANIATPAVKKLIKNNKLSLVRKYDFSGEVQELKSVGDFKEYGYFLTDSYIKSENIPIAIYNSTIDFLKMDQRASIKGLPYRPRDIKKIINMVWKLSPITKYPGNIELYTSHGILKRINSILNSLSDKSEDLYFYRVLLDQDIIDLSIELRKSLLEECEKYDNLNFEKVDGLLKEIEGFLANIRSRIEKLNKDFLNKYDDGKMEAIMCSA